MSLSQVEKEIEKLQKELLDCNQERKKEIESQIKKQENMNNEEKVVSYYKETLEKKIEWTFRLQSTLLTVASATFAVLVSLSNLSTNNACSRILLLVVICSNALSILFSCITIYECAIRRRAAYAWICAPTGITGCITTSRLLPTSSCLPEG